MKSKQYFSTSLEKQKNLTQQRLNNFLNDPQAKIFFMSEPVGYGKTTTLMDLCLSPKQDGSFRRSVFLTYSNRKAAELEGEFLERIDKLNKKPKLLRLFGESHIKNETRYKLEDDIDECHNSYERKSFLERNKPPFLVCEKKCKVNDKCPYYRTTTDARENGYDILIGNLGELQNSFFYLDKKFKFPQTELFVLDEDAVKKSKFEYDIPEQQIVAFIDNLKDFPKYLKEQESLADLSENEINILLKRFEKIFNFFEHDSGFYVKDKQSEIKVELIEKRGFDFKKVNASRSRKWFEDLESGAKDHRKSSWFKPLLHGLLTNSAIQLVKKAGTAQGTLIFYPDIKDFRLGFSEIGLTKSINSKTVITDATSSVGEIVARFGIENEEELALSYDPFTDGFIEPKGTIFQVVENISKTQYFQESNINKYEKEIKTELTTKLLEVTKFFCDSADFSKDERWIIPFREFAESKVFQDLAAQHGFKVSANYYHGAVRGLNELKEKDIVILGSNFPRDESVSQQQLVELSKNVVYDYSDVFLQWVKSEEKSSLSLISRTQQELKIKSWISFLEKDHGKIGRKIYLENIIQSMRSRFFWNNTKTLIYSAYPLVDFGIAVHGLMGRDDFNNEYMKKPSGSYT